MISYDKLKAADAPQTLAEGWNKMEIKKAEIKISKAGDPYLNVGMQVVLPNGKYGAYVFDILKEASDGFMLYKLRKFVEGFDLPVNGNFELEDLTKVLVGRQAMVQLKIDNNPNYGKKSVVDIRNEMYIPLKDYQPEQEMTAGFTEIENDIPFAEPEKETPIELDDEEI